MCVLNSTTCLEFRHDNDATKHDKQATPPTRSSKHTHTQPKANVKKQGGGGGAGGGTRPRAQGTHGQKGTNKAGPYHISPLRHLPLPPLVPRLACRTPPPPPPAARERRSLAPPVRGAIAPARTESATPSAVHTYGAPSERQTKRERQTVAEAEEREREIERERKAVVTLVDPQPKIHKPWRRPVHSHHHHTIVFV